MTLKEFVSMVEDVSKSVKSEISGTENSAPSLFHRELGGIHCFACLKSDGSLSSEQTSINVQFIIQGKG